MTEWTTIGVLLAWVPAVAAVHEVGHALAARPAGFRVTSFGIGRGRPLFRHRARGGVILYVGRWLFAGGTCVAIPRGAGTGPRAALFHAGGVLAQGVLALVLLALPDWWWVSPVARFNLLVAGWNLVPWRVGGLVSDGWWLLSALGGVGGVGPQIYTRRRPMARIQAFEEQVGSPVGTWYTRLVGAWMDLQTGNLSAADAFFGEDHSEPVLDPELDVLHHALGAEWHRRHRRPLAALHDLRALRDAYGAGLSPDSADLLAAVEARTLLDLDEPAAARQVLAQLAGVGGMAGQEAAVIRLEAALGADDVDEVEQAARRVLERLRGVFMDPAAAVNATWEAARSLQSADRRDASATLAHAARQAAGRLVAAAEPEDRAHLVRRLGEAAGLKALGDQQREPGG